MKLKHEVRFKKESNGRVKEKIVKHGDVMTPGLCSNQHGLTPDPLLAGLYNVLTERSKVRSRKASLTAESWMAGLGDL